MAVRMGGGHGVVAPDLRRFGVRPPAFGGTDVDDQDQCTAHHEKHQEHERRHACVRCTRRAVATSRLAREIAGDHRIRGVSFRPAGRNDTAHDRRKTAYVGDVGGTSTMDDVKALTDLILDRLQQVWAKVRMGRGGIEPPTR